MSLAKRRATPLENSCRHSVPLVDLASHRDQIIRLRRLDLFHALCAVLAFCDDLRMPVSSSSSSFVHHKLSGSNMSRTVRPRITIFYRDIHTDIVDSHTGHGITYYFRSEVKANKKRTLTASGRISGERFGRVSRIVINLSGIVGTTTTPDMTSLAASGWLSRCN